MRPSRHDFIAKVKGEGRCNSFQDAVWSPSPSTVIDINVTISDRLLLQAMDPTHSQMLVMERKATGRTCIQSGTKSTPA